MFVCSPTFHTCLPIRVKGNPLNGSPDNGSIRLLVQFSLHLRGAESGFGWVRISDTRPALVTIVLIPHPVVSAELAYPAGDVLRNPLHRVIDRPTAVDRANSTGLIKPPRKIRGRTWIATREEENAEFGGEPKTTLTTKTTTTLYRHARKGEG